MSDWIIESISVKCPICGHKHEIQGDHISVFRLISGFNTKVSCPKCEYTGELP